MTAADWLNSPDPTPMLNFLWGSGKCKRRKLKLFTIAWLRMVWDSLRDERSRQAVVLAERFADDGVAASDLETARVAAEAAVQDREEQEWETDLNEYEEFVIRTIMELAAQAASDDAWSTAFEVGQRAAAPSQADLLRDIFGPSPFRPPTPLDSAVLAWRDATVVRLALAAYEERELPSGHLDRHRLAVLADALEEAGADAELVGHLRVPGPHWRGCHVVDLILGKG